MSSRTVASEAGPALVGPHERAHFKELLLANHFQGMVGPTEGAPPMGNTSYEELVCVGFQPQLGQLNAVVHIKQESGYSGGICTAGSQEYVAFYSSTDDGATWTALGTTSFTTWDVTGAKPLEYDVTLPVELPAACCQDENIVLIRAVLSWEVPPSGANDPVVWGNGLDAHVQVAPIALGTLANLFECLKVPFEAAKLGDVVNLDQVVEFGSGKQLTPLELHETYKGADIPQHRYLLASVSELLADPIALSKAASETGFALVPGLKGVDLGSIIGVLLDPQGNETYEQLGCVGLNTSTYQLAATVEVKLSSGYSGNLCTSGSNEYVAFWADWGSGYEYVGTTSVNVHDLTSIPAGGVQYAATLPFPQALTHRRPCTDGPVTVPIRAVLSWSALPSDTDPYAVPVWGGHLETTVLLPPGEPVTGGGPVLESIASMPLLYIDPAGLATGQSTVGFYANGCPFGGSINFSGWVMNPATGLPGGPGMQYRILISPNNGATYTPMTDAFTVVTTNLPSGVQHTVVQHPDVNGWCDYLADFSTPGSLVDVVQNILGYWGTAGDNQLWISMEAQQGATPLGATPWKRIQLDNTAPTAAVAITSGGGSCGDFTPGDLITGTYSASDNEDLSSVSIDVEMPMLPATPQKVAPITVTLTTESGHWSLQTLATTQPCGYTITATATDNTIVNSGGIGWHGYGYTGLCLRPKP